MNEQTTTLDQELMFGGGSANVRITLRIEPGPKLISMQLTGSNSIQIKEEIRIPGPIGYGNYERIDDWFIEWKKRHRYSEEVQAPGAPRWIYQLCPIIGGIISEVIDLNLTPEKNPLWEY